MRRAVSSNFGTLFINKIEKSATFINYNNNNNNEANGCGLSHSLESRDISARPKQHSTTTGLYKIKAHII